MTAPGNIRRWLIFSAALVALAVALMAIGRRWVDPILFGMASMVVYSVGAPWFAFRARRFWLAAPAAIVAFVLVFAVVVESAEAIHGGSYGDDDMVYLLPFMIFPTLLLAAMVVRIGLWLRSRATRSTA